MDNQVEETILRTYTAEEVDGAAVLLLQRKMEHWTIKNVFAPLKKFERDKMLKRYKDSIAQIGDDSKTAITSLADQLETGMKGQFSKKVSETVTQKAQQYDKL